MSYRPSHNLLIVSDLHLGADLKRTGFAYLRGVATLDREFGRFLDWYLAHPEGELPWRLIVNGDMVDFINVTMLPADGETTGFVVSENEKRFGLSGEETKVSWMLDKIVDRHRALFEKLAAFVAAGHELAIVRGNPDVEFHWPSVQERFRQALAGISGLTGEARDAFLARVTFLPWFYYEPETIFVEHGHQYDEYSSFEYLLAPVAAEEPKRVDLPLSHFAIRYLANAFPNISTHDKDGWTFLDYMKLAVGGKSGGFFALLFAYAVTFLRVLRVVVRRKLRRVHFARLQHVAQLKKLAHEWAMPLEQLLRLERLHRGDALRSAFRAAQCFYADRFLLFGSGIVAVGLLLESPVAGASLYAAIAVVAAIVLGVNALLSSTRKAELPPKLRTAGRAVALLLNVPLVVMGHSHKPAVAADEHVKARYVNTGTWIPAHGEKSVSFTHLMVRRGALATADGGARTLDAELRRWNAPESRPEPLSES